MGLKLGSISCCCGCTIFADDFDREDSAAVGDGWTVEAGAAEIVSNQLRLTAPDTVVLADETAGTEAVFLSVDVTPRDVNDELRLYTGDGTVYLELVVGDVSGTGRIKLVTTTGETLATSTADLAVDETYTMTLCIVEVDGTYYAIGSCAGYSVARATAYTSRKSGVSTGSLADAADFDNFSASRTAADNSECPTCGDDCLEEECVPCVEDDDFFCTDGWKLPKVPSVLVPDFTPAWSASGLTVMHDTDSTCGGADNTKYYDLDSATLRFRVLAETTISLDWSVEGPAGNPPTTYGYPVFQYNLALLCGDGFETASNLSMTTSGDYVEACWREATPEEEPCFVSLCGDDACKGYSGSGSDSHTLPPGIYELVVTNASPAQLGNCGCAQTCEDAMKASGPASHFELTITGNVEPCQTAP